MPDVPVENMAEELPLDLDAQSYFAIAKALETLRKNKPTDRSDAARYYAVAITELEKALAYFQFFVYEMED